MWNPIRILALYISSVSRVYSPDLVLLSRSRHSQQVENITKASDAQYGDNMGIQPTVRSLEILSMKPNEGFTDYLTRWKKTKAVITDKPKEDELRKFFNNLQEAPYASTMRYSNWQNFGQITILGINIEDDIRRGILNKDAATTVTDTTKEEDEEAI